MAGRLDGKIRDWSTFEINTFAAIHMLQVATRSMIATGGGAVINITSRLAAVGVPAMGIYGASKGGDSVA